MRGKIAPPRDVCIFCALRFGRPPQALRREFPIQSRTYTASARYDRPAAAAYAVKEDEHDEPPQSVREISKPPKPATTAWPTFVPKKLIPKTPEPAIKAPEEKAVKVASSGWICSSCGNFNLPRRIQCVNCKVKKGGIFRRALDTDTAQPIPRSRSDEFRDGKEGSQSLRLEDRNNSIQEGQSEKRHMRPYELSNRRDQTQKAHPTIQKIQYTLQKSQSKDQEIQSTISQSQSNKAEVLDQKLQAPLPQSERGGLVDQKENVHKLQPELAGAPKQTPKSQSSWGGFLDQQKQASKPQPNWGQFLNPQKDIAKPRSNGSGSLGRMDHMQMLQRQLPSQAQGRADEMVLGSSQKEQALRFGDFAFDTQRERPFWRRPTDNLQDGRGGGAVRPSLFLDPNRRFQFRAGQFEEEQSQGSEQQDLSGSNRLRKSIREDGRPMAGTSSSSTQPVFQSRESLVNQRVSLDTGNRSGLEALLQLNAETEKSKSRRKPFAEADFPVRHRGMRDSMPMEGENVRRAQSLDRIDPSQAHKAVMAEMHPGDKGIYWEPGGSHLSTPRRHDNKPQSPESEEEGRQRRGRFQADLDEPEVAVAKVEPRHTRRPARNASSKKSTYQQDEADDDLLFEERGRKKKAKVAKVEAEPVRPSIQLPEFISVENLAKGLRVRIEDFLNRMEEMGFERPRRDHVLDAETSGLIATEFDFEPTYSEQSRVQDLVARPLPEDVSSLPSRPPIVTIMGHVDHGKTTILDWLRKSSVVESEHGGITQHIGAFSVAMPGGKQITFLDTPGHAAFLDMRRRGANVTDIVILVVAADDSVKPQTLEAIKHATDAKVPIIVAMNKVDKEDANVDRVKQDLARHGVTVEDYGGDVQAIPVSGKFGKGMAELEEATVTLSELLDHRAEIDGPVEGWIIESKVTTAGRVATILVRRGTLRPGDIVVAGNTWARIRTLRNDAGVIVEEAPPGTPVQIDGWRGEDPLAGWEVLEAENEEQAKAVVELRLERQEHSKLADDTAAINATRAEEAAARAQVLAWEAEQEWARKRAHRRPKDNAGWIEGKASSGPKQVHFVVKADVSGSVEAVVNAVSAIGNNAVAANVIRSGVGVLNESDVHHLASSGETGYLVSFNQPVDAAIARLAAANNLPVLDYNVIYKVTDAVREKLTAELPPVITQKVVGEADVGKVFEISVKKGKMKIAGCKITNGVITRDKKIRVLRRSQVLYDGSLHSLKNVKKDVAEMRKGTECGMGFEGWEDFIEGDLVQCYEEVKTQRSL